MESPETDPDQYGIELRRRAEFERNRPQIFRRGLLEFEICLILVVATVCLANHYFAETGAAVSIFAWAVAIPIFNDLNGRGNC